MNNGENNFEEFLRSKLEDHTIEVSDSVWAGIEKKRKKREVFIWFKHCFNLFIALDIFIFCGLTAFSMLKKNEVQAAHQLHAIFKNKHVETPYKKIAVNDDEALKQTKNNEIKKNQKINNDAIINSANSFAKQKQASILALKSAVAETKANTAVTTKTRAEENNGAIYPIHENTTNKATEKPLFAFASIKPHDINAILFDLNNDIQINDRMENPVFLAATLVLSKSKKVLKAEQKALAKAQKESAKQIENNIVKVENSNQKNHTTQENTSQSAASIEATAMNSEATPIAFDTVYGQKKFKGYIAFDALLSPEFAGRRLKGTNEQALNYISRRDSAESLRLAYSALMRINLFVTKNIFIHTGISFSQRQEKFSIAYKWQSHEDYIDSTKFVTYIDPFEGNIIYKTYDTLDYVTTHKDTITHDVRMTFIAIPAMIGYKWLGKRSGIALQAGVIYNLLFKQKGTVANYNYAANDVSNNNQNPFKKRAGLSLSAGISTNYRLNDKLDLLIEPHSSYILKSITNADYPVQQKLFTYGLNIGLRLKL